VGVSDEGPLLLVTVGTDHHRFDRLADWIERWAVGGPARLRVIYQEGASRAPAGARTVGIVARDHLLGWIDQADVVVAQAGPGSIADANERGRVPIVVPRRARLDEVVDDHQVGFAARMATLGRAHVAMTEAELHEHLHRAFVDPAYTRMEPLDSPASRAASELDRVIDEVMTRRPGFVSLRRAPRSETAGPRARRPDPDPDGASEAPGLDDVELLLIASNGGHLAQLVALRPSWEPRPRRWVSFRASDAEALLAREQVTWAFHPTTRNLWNALRNTLLAVRDLLRDRPDLLVSTGAGVAVPYFLVARLLRIRTVYIEVFDRVDTPTLSGRLCSRMSDAFCLQWREQRASYPDGVVIGPVL
jgi:UDP-N-acetylglucosamine transferase subunit ALG13